MTVLGWHMGSGFPDIVRLGPADLEPLLASLENTDMDLIAAAVAEQRRRDLEQMRNQNGHRS